MSRNLDNSKELSDKEFDEQLIIDNIQSVGYLVKTMKNTRIQILAYIVKNTTNNCLSCRKYGAYVYCPIFNEHFADNKDFDETGELDGCSEYTPSNQK